MILFGDQVLDQFALLELAARWEPNGNKPALAKATLPIAGITIGPEHYERRPIRRPRARPNPIEYVVVDTAKPVI